MQVVIRELKPGVWLVPSFTPARADEYIVDLNRGICSCRSFMVETGLIDGKCKHIRAVEQGVNVHKPRTEIVYV